MRKKAIQHRFGTASLVGISGAMVALAVISTQHAFRGDWTIVRVAFGGAFMAGLLLANGFGRPGAWGWFYAGMSFGAATILGAFFAVLLLPLDHVLGQGHHLSPLGDVMRMSLLGPVYIIELVMQGDWLALVWGGGMSLSQIASQPLRQS